ncbi:hypothetical protein SCG7086_BD_00110 [Chlamydiales bacterium SCGC AG-110-P3]|nr:hypothetical protein SCG7086_BD_00110 [Chlamydiales bacterium SCGC AG-110-P3]
MAGCWVLKDIFYGAVQKRVSLDETVINDLMPGKCSQ